MDEVTFRRLRQLILDSTEIHDDGICFDTSIALEKGYSEEEIAIADDLLTNCSFYTTDFVDKIRYWYGDCEYKPLIYFVEFAKIIFIIDRKPHKATHMFEEDLEKEVFLKQYLTICDDHFKQHFNPGSCGELQEK